MSDEVDADCPLCRRNAAAGECICYDDGDVNMPGAERLDRIERGRARVRNDSRRTHRR